VIRGEAWGNLYLTEKGDGEQFDQADEELATLLAQWAAIAIENARLYQRLERRGEDMAQVLRALEAGVEISRAAGGGASARDLLELVAKRARDLIKARAVVVVQAAEGSPTVVAAAGEGSAGILGRELDLHRPIFADALQLRGGGRVSSAAGRLIEFDELGLVAESALIAPLEFRNRPNGMLLALDKLEGLGFGPEDEVALTSFAANAANSIVTADAVEAQQLRRAIAAADSERARWARELHDETLQELGALRLTLEAGVARGDPEQMMDAATGAVEGLDAAIRNLQGLLTELRPAALDELGVGPALESLADRASAASGVDVELELRLDDQHGRLDPDLESTIYRLVQESLNNAIKHGGPESISASVVEDGDLIKIRVSDDGDGFDPDSVEHGFGLVGMGERVRLGKGSLRLDSRPGSGTEVLAELPVARP
jgi:signal transduction histidine kinase